MKQIGNMRSYSLDEITDELIGKEGTAERNKFDMEVEESVRAFQIGEAIRKARTEQKMTQAELGERAGVNCSQVSKMENGRNISFQMLGRIFKALGVKTASLDLGTCGKLALW